MRLGPIYRGTIYLAKRLQGVFFFKIKVNACILTRPLSNHKFEGIIYKYFVLFIVHFFPYTPINGDQWSQGNLEKKRALFFPFEKKIAIQTQR